MRTYTPEQKATILAAYVSGQTIAFLSREHDIPKGTIAAWVSKIPSGENQTISVQKKKSIADQLMDLVETEIESLRQISLVTRDPAWLKQQTAADLAIFNGVKHDKLYRILEAFSANSRTAQD